MLVQFNIETIQVDMALAERTAAVRARTNLKRPGAGSRCTAIERNETSGGHTDGDTGQLTTTRPRRTPAWRPRRVNDEGRPGGRPS